MLPSRPPNSSDEPAGYHPFLRVQSASSFEAVAVQATTKRDVIVTESWKIENLSIIDASRAPRVCGRSILCARMGTVMKMRR